MRKISFHPSNKKFIETKKKKKKKQKSQVLDRARYTSKWKLLQLDKNDNPFHIKFKVTYQKKDFPNNSKPKKKLRTKIND